VIVSGPPASGKSTIALPLARALGLPLVAKDVVKEALAESLGAGTLERSRELGRATYGVIFALARSHLDTGAGLVLEANFARAVSEVGLRPLVAGSRAVMVHCWAPREVLVARYRARAGRRHPAHLDLLRLEAGPPWLDPPATEPPDLDVPCLRLDTTAPVDVGAVAAWTRAELAAQRR